MRCKKRDFTIPIQHLVKYMLKIGVTENCIVKSFAQYSATTLQNITKYFFNKRLKINDNIFVIALKKYEDKIVAEELREMLMADNQGAVFKKIF